MIFNQLGTWFNAKAQGHAALALQCGVTSTLGASRAATAILGGPGSLHIDHLPSPCFVINLWRGTGSIWVSQSVQPLGGAFI